MPDIIYTEPGTNYTIILRDDFEKHIEIQPNNKIIISPQTKAIHATLTRKFKESNSDEVELTLADDIPEKYRTVRIKGHGHNSRENGCLIFYVDEYEITNAPIKELKHESLTVIAGILANYKAYIEHAEKTRIRMQDFYDKNIRPNYKYLNTGFIITHKLNELGCELKDLSDNEIQKRFHLSRTEAETAEKLIKDIQYHKDMIYLIDN